MESTIQIKTKLKTFEIGYKGYYGELSDWFTDRVKSESEEAALRKFLEERGVEPECQWCGYIEDKCQSSEVQKDNSHEFEPSTKTATGDLEWKEGSWFMVFRYIKEVTMKPCPHCGGTGEIAVDADN
jgi:hypothetical protein